MSARTYVSVLLVSLHVLVHPLWAGCPRTGGEKARRIVPAVLTSPVGLLVLLHGQSRAPMPQAGARVRVSHDTPDGLRFTEGAFVAVTDSAFQLVTGRRDTVMLPLASARCLQVYRLSRPIGIAVGLGVGGPLGLITGFVIGLSTGEAWAGVGGALLGGGVGFVAGALVGARRGATAWDVGWERQR